MSGGYVRDGYTKLCGPVVVPMAAFRFVEGLLRTYPGAQRALARAQAPKGIAPPTTAVRGAQRHRIYTKALKRQSSPDPDRLRRLCEVVEHVLLSLDDRERAVVEAFYFKRQGDCNTVAASLGLHRSTFCRDKDRAVLAFMLVFQKVMDVDLLRVV